jgi:hypothetical protein
LITCLHFRSKTLPRADEKEKNRVEENKNGVVAKEKGDSLLAPEKKVLRRERSSALALSSFRPSSKYRS